MSIKIATRNTNQIERKKGTHSPQRKKFSSALTFSEPSEKRTIVLYSPDMDLCVSLRMLFQERYNVVTTTEPEIMMMMVKSFKPDLVIVDALPTERMRFRFSEMRKIHPHVHIMIFYASFFDNPRLHEFIRQSVDAAFSKPIDLAEVTKRINDFAVSAH